VAVAGPTIEALRFAADEPTLRELYASLLATSMTSSSRNKAHPAFVDIIKQLDVVDVHILNAVYTLTRRWKSDKPDEDTLSRWWSGTYMYHWHPVHRDEIKSEVDVSDEVYETSLDNLLRVRCVASFIESKKIKTTTYDRHEYYEDASVDHHYNLVHITNLGINFVEACIDKSSNASE
jgi:hypothetical protein